MFCLRWSALGAVVLLQEPRRSVAPTSLAGTAGRFPDTSQASVAGCHRRLPPSQQLCLNEATAGSCIASCPVQMLQQICRPESRISCPSRRSFPKLPGLDCQDCNHSVMSQVLHGYNCWQCCIALKLTILANWSHLQFGGVQGKVLRLRTQVLKHVRRQIKRTSSSGVHQQGWSL